MTFSVAYDNLGTDLYVKDSGRFFFSREITNDLGLMVNVYVNKVQVLYKELGLSENYI